MVGGAKCHIVSLIYYLIDYTFRHTKVYTQSVGEVSFIVMGGLGLHYTSGIRIVIR